MSALTFDELLLVETDNRSDWLWHGFLLPGAMTLFTAQWKTGKTTLLSHLLRAMGNGGSFLDRPVAPSKVYVLSEETPFFWKARGRQGPFPASVRFDCKPFKGVPDAATWGKWLDERAIDRRRGDLDLLVVDPVSSFLPCSNEGLSASVLATLATLDELLSLGCAVLLLHHPRKGASATGQAARGSGAWTSRADINMEMRPVDAEDANDRRRRLLAWSRHADTPRETLFTYRPDETGYDPISTADDPLHGGAWAVIQSVLIRARDWFTAKTILEEWPEDHERPHPRTLRLWLAEAVKDDLVKVKGDGYKGNPLRYALASSLAEIERRNRIDPRTGLKPLILDDEDDFDPLDENHDEYHRGKIVDEVLSGMGIKRRFRKDKVIQCEPGA